VKKLNTLAAILVIIFAVSSLKAQTYPVPKFALHIYGGYTLPLPDLKGIFPDDVNSGKNPTPYFLKSGYNVGADGKYFVDKKSTFGIMLSANYTMLSSGDIGVNDATEGTGTFRATMTIFQIGVGGEYDFAPKRPANPFVNANVTANFIGGSRESNLTGGTDSSYLGNVDMKGAVRFGVRFGAGVDVKLSKNIGIIIGGKYCFLNLFGKGDYTANTSTNTYLNDVETTTMKAKKIVYLQFYAGMSFYFGQRTTPVIKK
jgi:opacity protein-like surface antigen